MVRLALEGHAQQVPQCVADPTGPHSVRRVFINHRCTTFYCDIRVPYRTLATRSPVSFHHLALDLLYPLILTTQRNLDYWYSGLRGNKLI